MNCPVDNTPLAMSERQGVEIDYCPTCRGVWLDRGELDKIIERANQEAESASHRDQPDDDYREGGRSESGKPKKRRRSFLADMFEGGGD